MRDDRTSIRIPVKLRERLKKRKVHPNQPYYEVIRELLEDDSK